MNELPLTRRRFDLYLVGVDEPFGRSMRFSNYMIRGSTPAGDVLPEELEVGESSQAIVRIFRRRCDILIVRTC